MHWISIPFDMRFQDAMLFGIKTCTSRSRCYGKAGDRFEVFGAQWCIDEVQQVYLWRVATYAFSREGFANSQAFIDFWKRLHPNRGYQPNDLVYLHKFHKENR